LATKAKCGTDVIVATDDQRIIEAVESFGGRAVMTDPNHPSGTDRIAEVAEKLDAEVIVNLQGDEPQFAAADVDKLAAFLTGNRHLPMATLATPIRSDTDYRNPNIVKVVCDEAGRALYFSRSPIPMVRDGEPNFGSGQFLQHLGVYAYRRDVLLTLAKTPPTLLEQTEKLEQLRALYHGIPIRVGVIPAAHKGVDTPADYEAFVRSYRASGPAGG
jgi:3-deoxy-manno-octulosonate cytidylyltransferase (CMP-KDO synthetase)